MALTMVLSGLSVLTTDLHLATTQDDGKIKIGAADVSKSFEGPYGPVPFSVGWHQDLVRRAKKKGFRVASTIDTYLALVMPNAKGAVTLKEEDIDFVFPWPAETPCHVAPDNADRTDKISRWVAWYYNRLGFQFVQDWQGTVKQFDYKANNTVSLRSHAAYQVVKKQNRALMRPADPDAAVLSFDWKAAEWRLCAMMQGYNLDEDAYGPFLDLGERKAVKDIVLRYIYGSSIRALHRAHGQTVTDHTVRRLHDLYPRVIIWRDYVRTQESVMFQGFQIPLHDVPPEKRANRVCQTALQLCKHDLVSRLAYLMAQTGKVIAAGDLHDALYFHVRPDQEDVAQNAIDEIKKPCFGSVNLVPDFTFGRTWT